MLKCIEVVLVYVDISNEVTWFFPSNVYLRGSMNRVLFHTRGDKMSMDEGLSLMLGQIHLSTPAHLMTQLDSLSHWRVHQKYFQGSQIEQIHLAISSLHLTRVLHENKLFLFFLTFLITSLFPLQIFVFIFFIFTRTKA